MREIKFRAWDKMTNKMSVVNSIWGFPIIDHITVDFEDTVNTLFNNFDLMQFTGLQDKNGVDIYEGDILQFITRGFDSEVFTTEIIYKDCAFKLRNGRSLFYFGQTNLTKIDDAKIVGNIHENKNK